MEPYNPPASFSTPSRKFLVAINRQIVDKVDKDINPNDFEILTTAFVNEELTLAEIASEINEGHPFCAQHDGRRLQENFKVAQLLALDFDKVTQAELDEIMEHPLVKPYYSIFYHTVNHTPEKPRARIVFALDEPIINGNYYREIVLAFLWKFDTSDKTCKDACRPYYGAKGHEPIFTENVLPMSVVSSVLKEHHQHLEVEKQAREKAEQQRRATSSPESTGGELKFEDFCQALSSLPYYLSGDDTESYNKRLGFAGAVSELFGENGIAAIQNHWPNGGKKGERINWSAKVRGLHGGSIPPIATIISVFNENNIKVKKTYPNSGQAKSYRTTPAPRRAAQATPIARKSPADAPVVDPETGEIQEPAAIPILTHYNLTDMGNAYRLVERFGKDLKYVHAWGWVTWDGRRWRPDKTGAIERFAKETVKTIYAEASQIDEVEDRKATADFAKRCEAKNRRDAMIDDAKSETEVIEVAGAFDQGPMLLNCLNGTLDLETGELRSHSRADLITKIAPVSYDPAAECPTWLNFLDTIMDSNADLIRFLQRAIGYSLTGATREHSLFFLYGSGRNGKSTLLETIAALLGNYAATSSFNTFLEKDGDGPRNDIAKLAGSRFVSAVEADPGKRLAEGVIKQLTGGDTISARFLFKEEFEYKPSFKIWLGANHKPVIRGQDLGIWRRIKLIPFEVTIAESQVDKKLPERLKAELPGIFAWAVQGCLEWQKEGLTEPKEVTEATRVYQDESDPLRDFLSECTVKGRNKSVELKICFAAYSAWCKEAGEHPVGKQRFSQLLSERGLTIGRGNYNKFYIAGLDMVSRSRETQKKPEQIEEEFWDV